MRNRLGRACAILGAVGALATACSRAPPPTQTDVTALAAPDAAAAHAAPPDAEVDATEAADASDASAPLDLLAPTGPILRERAAVVVDGVAETWRLEWSEPPTPECATGEQAAMSCACWGFTIAETGPLDLVRSRPDMPDERLPLSPLFVGGKHAILQRWKLGEHERLPDDLGDLGMFRPAVTVMKLGDYDHDGRSTEFVLQIGASACLDVAVVVGISRSNPHLHAFGSAESPQTPVSLGHRAQWERLRTSSMIDVVLVPCGEHGMGWGDDGDGGMRCDLPDSALRIRADGEFHVTDMSRSCRGRMPGVDGDCRGIPERK